MRVGDINIKTHLKNTLFVVVYFDITDMSKQCDVCNTRYRKDIGCLVMNIKVSL